RGVGTGVHHRCHVRFANDQVTKSRAGSGASSPDRFRPGNDQVTMWPRNGPYTSPDRERRNPAVDSERPSLGPRGAGAQGTRDSFPPSSSTRWRRSRGHTSVGVEFLSPLVVELDVEHGAFLPVAK